MRITHIVGVVIAAIMFVLFIVSMPTLWITMTGEGTIPTGSAILGDLSLDAKFTLSLWHLSTDVTQTTNTFTRNEKVKYTMKEFFAKDDATANTPYCSNATGGQITDGPKFKEALAVIQGAQAAGVITVICSGVYAILAALYAFGPLKIRWVVLAPVPPLVAAGIATQGIMLDFQANFCPSDFCENARRLFMLSTGTCVMSEGGALFIAALCMVVVSLPLMLIQSRSDADEPAKQDDEAYRTSTTVQVEETKQPESPQKTV